MADAQSSLRSDLKKQIRALLQSVKRGCTFKQLSMDFRQVMGYDIPFDELGYSTFSQLIHDLPDVVEIRKNRDGSTTLHAVADQRTEHISRLVSKQKSTRALYTQPPPARKPPPRRAPREFSAQLRQLFCCYPQGIPLANFNEAYARRFGRFLQFQPWGYSSLEQLLQDMDGVELVCNPLKGSTMVKSRRKNMSLQLAKKVPPEESLNALETSPVREKSIEKCLREAKQKKEPTPPARPPIPDRLINNIRELLQAHPAGIWLSQFSAQYKEYYGEELPVFTQGYSTPLHLLSSLSQVVSIERPHLGNGDWLVAEVGAIVKVAPNHAFLSSAYISDELTATIHRILAPAPEGIMLNSFLRTYKEKAGKELEIRELGFNTLVQLLERVDGVAVMKPPDAGFMMVYGPRKKGGGVGGSSCGS
ncbi:Tudor domain-containing protein 5, partial [Geodia barretti]